MLFFVLVETGLCMKLSMDWQIERMVWMLLTGCASPQFPLVPSFISYLMNRIWYEASFSILTVGNALSVSLFGNSDPTYAAWQAVKCIPIQYNSNSSQTNCRRFDVSRTSRQNCRACLALCQCCVRLDCPRRHPY